MKKRKNKIFVCVLSIMICLSIWNGYVRAEEEDTVSITYRTHIQTYGWQDWQADGSVSGTTGLSKRLEAIEICLNSSYPGGVEYRAHVQSYGWMDWVEEGGISGTSGQSKRMEAIQIKLTGEMADVYDIYYRVHAQSYGWLG